MVICTGLYSETNYKRLKGCSWFYYNITPNGIQAKLCNPLVSEISILGIIGLDVIGWGKHVGKGGLRLAYNRWESYWTHDAKGT